MPLQDKLDGLKAEFGPKIPAEIRAVFERTIGALVASGQAERALKAGDRAPAFTLPDPDGNLVASADLLRHGPLVVSFYRGVWCPYCNVELGALEEAYPDIRARGAALVAISPQTAQNSRKAQRDHSLTFPILSDHGGELSARFGIRWEVGPEMQAVHQKFGSDLTVVNGDTKWALPMPARYVIGRDGVIAYAEVNPDYTRRPDPSELFPTLDRLMRAAA